MDILTIHVHGIRVRSAYEDEEERLGACGQQ